MKRFLILQMVALSILSCEYNFEPKGLVEEPTLYLAAMPTNRDSMVVRFQKTVPVSSGKGKRYSPLDVTFRLYVNGQLSGETVEYTEWLSDVTDNMPYDNYFIRHAFQPGDEIRVEADLPGFATLSAQTSLPQPTVLESVSAHIDPDKTLTYRIRYRSTENSSPYHAAQLLWGDECAIYPSSLFRDDILSSERVKYIKFNYFGSNPEFVNRNFPTVFWEDRDATSDGENLVYEFKDAYPRETYPDTDEEQAVGIYAHVFALSSEAFHHVCAVYDYENNALGWLGMSPVSYSYTNIHNGLGWFGAVTVSDFGPFGYRR